MVESNLKILCIEDDKDTCDLINFVFKYAGYEIITCSHTDCLQIIHKENFLAIILDNYFDGLRGIDICQEIRSVHPQTPIIFFSGEARQQEIDKALSAGANSYLIKPNDFENLVPTVTKLIN